MSKQSIVRCEFYSTSQHIVFVLPHELPSQSYVLVYCQRYSTNINSVISCRFNIKNFNRVANTASDDVYNRVVMLN